jgi:hypothetical protein
MVRGKQGGKVLAHEIQEAVAGNSSDSDMGYLPKVVSGERGRFVEVRR